MKFLLLENVLTTVNFRGSTYFIYINPKGQELNSKEDTKWNRGIIDPEGNLYVEARWIEDGKKEREAEEKILGDTLAVYSEMIHDHLIQFLQGQKKILDLVAGEWYDEPKFLQYGLCVHRHEDSMDFFVAESYDGWITSNDSKQLIKNFFTACKKKNPFINFYSRQIWSG